MNTEVKLGKFIDSAKAACNNYNDSIFALVEYIINNIENNYYDAAKSRERHITTDSVYADYTIDIKDIIELSDLRNAFIDDILADKYDADFSTTEAQQLILAALEKFNEFSNSLDVLTIFLEQLGTDKNAIEYIVDSITIEDEDTHNLVAMAKLS
jgi:cation transport regulator ChaC